MNGSLKRYFVLCILLISIPGSSLIAALREKRIDRKFPIFWCPMPEAAVGSDSNDLSFTAEGGTVRITFVARNLSTDPFFEWQGIGIDNIAVVEKSIFDDPDHQKAFGDFCSGAAGYSFDDPSTPEVFLDLIDSFALDNWEDLVNASFVTDSAPRNSSGTDQSGGSLRLGPELESPQQCDEIVTGGLACASTVVTGLEIGQTYVLSGWWWSEVDNEDEDQLSIIIEEVGPPALPLGDDTFSQVSLPFVFPYCGIDYDTVFVGSNGFLTFASGDTSFTESIAGFLSGAPRIAGLWDDLNPAVGGVVTAGTETGSDFVVRFSNVPEWPAAGSNSFAIKLRPNGSIGFEYGALSATDGLAGLSPGLGAADPGEIDLSSSIQPITGIPGTATYEFFSDNQDNDLANRQLEFSPCLRACTIPVSGDWIIDSDCVLTHSAAAPASVIILTGISLTLAEGVALDILSPASQLVLGAGADIKIRSGGRIRRE